MHHHPYVNTETTNHQHWVIQHLSFVDVDVSLMFHFIGAATTATSLEMMKGWSYVDVYNSLMFGIVTATTSSATIQELMKSWSNVDVDVSLMFARRVELMTCSSLVKLG